MNDDILKDPVRYRLLSAGVVCTDEIIEQIYSLGINPIVIADNLVRALPSLSAQEAMATMSKALREKK